MMICQKIATKSINGKKHPCVAVKLLLHTAMTKEDFESFVQAEYQSLEVLRDFETQHLIKAIAFYKTITGNVEGLFFVFPFAEQGNLRKFWKQTKPSIYENSHMTWVFEQLRGLADAIKTLHHERKDQTCRHGDLKPENVLCFKASGSTAVEDLTSCILVISDVGLSRIHDKSTQFRSQTRLAAGHTVTYAAPEAELFPKRPTTRRYDIWSLGCLYLEFIIWLLYGAEELERFGEERERAHHGEMNQMIGARFYIITSPETLTSDRSRTPVVNPAVTKWIEHIKQDPRCVATGLGETAIGRLISLIEKRLLIVTANLDSKTLTSPSNKTVVNNQATAASREHMDGTPKLLLVGATATDLSKAPQPIQSTENGDGERADAIEVFNKLNKIVQDARKGTIQWLNHQDGLEKEYKGPETETYPTVRPHTGSVSKNPDVSTIHVHFRPNASNRL
jgi:serine/threonine protein kinase